MVINDKTFIFTHGHIYSEFNMPDKADYLVMGHTHRCGIKRVGDLVVANPGSISLPRGGSPHSYMIISDKIIIKDIDGKEIEEVIV